MTEQPIQVKDECWFCANTLNEEDVYVDVKLCQGQVGPIKDTVVHRGHITCLNKVWKDLVSQEVVDMFANLIE